MQAYNACMPIIVCARDACCTMALYMMDIVACFKGISWLIPMLCHGECLCMRFTQKIYININFLSNNKHNTTLY